MRDSRVDSLPVLSAAGVMVAVACCAGLPLLGAIFGGLTLAALLGVAGGIVLVAAVLGAALVVLRGRRCRECSTRNEQVTR